MKEFLKRNKKKIINLVLLLVALIVISVVSMLILQAFGIVYYDEGIHLNAELFRSFTNSWYGWFIIIGMQVVITTLLSFIPGTSMAFILMIQAFFEKPWQAFLVAFIGVLLSSLIMYLTGRAGGYKICKKLMGEEDARKASNLLNKNGLVYFPIMMLFPIFPDDALVMIAGTLKMKLNWFVPSIVFGRGIGIATIVFGLAVIPYDKFTTPWHWIGFILICIVGLGIIFFGAHLFNKYLEKKRK